MGWRVERPSHPPEDDDELDQWVDADWKSYWEGAMGVSLTDAQWWRLKRRMSLEFWVDRWTRTQKVIVVSVAGPVVVSEVLQGIAAVIELTGQ